MELYIYQIPPTKYLKLKQMLNTRDKWKDLAGQIGTFTQENIDYIDSVKNKSPAEVLLETWSMSNPTVQDLFFHLKAIKYDLALNVLRDLVPDEFFCENSQQESESNMSQESDLDTSDLPLPPDQREGTLAQNAQENTWTNDFSSSSLSDQCRDDCAKLLNPHHGCLHDVVPKFTFNELCEATDNFSEQNVIGRGGFGTVYCGELNRLRQEVAIKKLKKKDGHELETIFRCRHTNIIQLLGFCETDSVYCLVYDYMKNGSLHDRLLCKNNTPPLTWFTRMKILFGASKGIYYLHSFEKPIIHGDIKSANILLDDNFEAKIADFGLAKQADSGQFTHKVYGSKDYLPDDYLEDTSQLTKEVDTFSFGIIIFETCLGVKAGDVKEIFKEQFIQLDPKCQNWPTQLRTEIIDIGFTCTARSKKQRPSMDKVVDKLETLMDSAQIIQQEKQQDDLLGASQLGEQLKVMTISESKSQTKQNLQEEQIDTDEIIRRKKKKKLLNFANPPQ